MSYCPQMADMGPLPFGNHIDRGYISVTSSLKSPQGSAPIMGGSCSTCMLKAFDLNTLESDIVLPFVL